MRMSWTLPPRCLVRRAHGSEIRVALYLQDHRRLSQVAIRPLSGPLTLGDSLQRLNGRWRHARLAQWGRQAQ